MLLALPDRLHTCLALSLFSFQPRHEIFMLGTKAVVIHFIPFHEASSQTLAVQEPGQLCRLSRQSQVQEEVKQSGTSQQ